MLLTHNTDQSNLPPHTTTIHIMCSCYIIQPEAIYPYTWPPAILCAAARSNLPSHMATFHIMCSCHIIQPNKIYPHTRPLAPHSAPATSCRLIQSTLKHGQLPHQRLWPAHAARSNQPPHMVTCHDLHHGNNIMIYPMSTIS